MVKRLTFLLILMTSINALALTQVTATIDKNPVMLNESLVLSIEADDSVSAADLDTSALLRDFAVGNTSTSSQTQIINGDVNQTTRWSVLLIPRKEGRFTIPAFTINGVSSVPINVDVVPVAAAQPGEKQDVFIDTSVQNENIYLQSAITYITKLYLAVDIQRGSLTEPKMENANIRQIGKDEELSEIKDGNRYRVIKRVYVITPQRSGEFTIESPIFNGEMVTNKRRSFFSGFNNSKPVSLKGKDLNITVKPIPDQYEGQWLPSEFVVLNEEWQPATQEYTVGEPITRTITLNAVGVSEEQLPEILATYPDEIKTYPDQSELNSVNRDDRLISQRKESIALVPAKPGKITLPEVTVPWWNTRTNSLEYAQLPAKIINVKPSANASTQPAIAPVVPAAQVPLTPNTTTIEQVPTNSVLTWAFLAAWIITILGWIMHVRQLRQAKTSPTTTPATASEQSAFKALSQACANNDGQAAHQQLLNWGQAKWPAQGFNSSLEVALFLTTDQDAALVKQVKQLQYQLYSKEASQQWQGGSLLKLIKHHQAPQKASAHQALSPLHPA